MSGQVWEVWSISTANMIAAEATEVEALELVRTLLAADWTADELVLIFDDPAVADEDLPPGVTGEELARRVEAAGSGRSHRTA
jgi:hypothetical protein